MVEQLVQAFGFDIRIRQAPPDPLPAKSVEIDAKEIEQGEMRYVPGETIYGPWSFTIQIPAAEP